MSNIIHYREPECSGTTDEDYYNKLLKEKYSANYWDKVCAVGEFIKSLPLTTEENDKLIDLLLAHLSSATQETFYIAFELGIEAAQSAADDNHRGQNRH